jgi:dihydroceramidase
LEIEPRYQLVFWIIALVGAGSMGFHGTLLRSMQVLDELPMVYGSLGLLYCARFRKARPELRPDDARAMRRWRWGLLLYSVTFTAAYFLHEATFQIFVGSFALATTVLALWGLKIAHEAGTDPTLRRIVYTSVVSFGAAAFVFWVPERHFPCDHGFQTIEPHAIFHLLAMVGTYGANLAFIFDRQACLERSPVIDLTGLAPFVRSGG